MNHGLQKIISLLLVLVFHSAFGEKTVCESFKFDKNKSPEISYMYGLEIHLDHKQNKLFYRPYQNIKVTLSSKTKSLFRKFLIRAEPKNTTLLNFVKNVGFFDFDSQIDIDCTNSWGNIAKNNGLGSWMKKEFIWRSTSYYGSVRFIAVIVDENGSEYIIQSDDAIEDAHSLPNIMNFIDTNDCGVSKGCYREPSGCKDGSCSLLLAWKDTGDVIDFELSALTDGWVAVGFSKDQYMGDDSIMECMNDNKKQAIVIQYSYNDKRSNVILKELPNHDFMDGYQAGKILRCRFQREKRVISDDKNKIFDLSDKYYILVARGSVINGKKSIHFLKSGIEPLVSNKKIVLMSHPNLSGKARYPLVKLHGCLMLIAWMMMSSLGILMSRYYKPVWPNKRFCNEKIWFFIHRACMIICCILTVIGFIVIFIQVGGYAEHASLPQKAHPPLGIIVTILAIANPLLTLLKCDSNGAHWKFRIIFNWIHWIFGSIAVVLSMPTVFIGLSMQKAAVPGWSTWVMVTFFLFHIIIELLLEVHGCINSKKQQYRDQEELLYKKNHISDEPDYKLKTWKPVGQNFKSTIFGIYLIIWLLLGIIMIAAVASG